MSLRGRSKGIGGARRPRRARTVRGLLRALPVAALALLAWALAPAAQAQVDTHVELWSAELTVGEDQDMDPRGYCESSSRDACREVNEQISQNHGFGALTDDDFVRGGVRHRFRGIFWFDSGRFAGDLVMTLFSDSMPKADIANWTLHLGDRSYELSGAENLLDRHLKINEFFDSANPPPATVSAEVSGVAQLALSTDTLTFTTENWHTPQPVDLAAFGTRGVLARGDGGFELAAVSDALYTETRSDAARGLVGAGSGATSRVRLMLEGSGSVAFAGGVFEPVLEAALRYDGGDAETGAGVEVGAGLGYTSGRLSVQVDARGLLAHEDGGYEERGVGGSLSWRPGRGGRGWALELASGRGATESTVQGLWSQADAFGLSRDAGTHAAGTDSARRFRSELSYGVPGRKRGALWVPYIGAETSAAEQLYRVGLKLTLGTATEAGLEYTRRSATGGREPEGAMRFDLSARW